MKRSWNNYRAREPLSLISEDPKWPSRYSSLDGGRVLPCHWLPVHTHTKEKNNLFNIYNIYLYLMQCNLHKADKRVMGSCKLLSWSGCLLIFTENALLSAAFREINAYWHLEALLPRFCPRWQAGKSHRGWVKMIANVLEQCIFGHPLRDKL